MVRLLRLGLTARECERTAPAVATAVSRAHAGSCSRRRVLCRAPPSRAPPLLAAAGLRPASCAPLSAACTPQRPPPPSLPSPPPSRLRCSLRLPNGYVTISIWYCTRAVDESYFDG
ncbi:hypothetical protein GGX14DRAFT_574757 [Mycena pura]|uniref:Uncharacterized protein n=1 Tax=Mycena pura TaxID=153505 RepID=A0AAD6V0V3_9AGAR|nr:hypothetical protein GGX14DRAFT_574757 [Mycena pura]